MTALARPDVRLHASWAATVLEFGGEPIPGSGTFSLPDHLRDDVTSERCAEVVAELLRWADVATAVPDGMVHCDYYWVTDGEDETDEGAEVVGFVAVRHRLTAFLLEQGGHVGYAVRPSRRRSGHAVAALRLAVARARELGVAEVLVTADDDNVASLRTIEAAGGVREDVRGRKARYWIATGGPVRPGDGSGPVPR